MKTIKVTGAILILAIIASTSFAQPGPKAGNGPDQRFESRAHIGLDLNDQQKAALEELKLSLQKEILPLRNQLRENRAKMNTLTTAENVDMKVINKLIDENSKLMASMEKLKVANHQKLRSMLTEEQRIKLDSHAFMRKAHRGEFQRSEQGQGRHSKGQGRGAGYRGIDK